jgi:hypothetical protein
MLSTPEDVVAAALQLPEVHRLALASQLMNSLPDDVVETLDDPEEFERELLRRSGDLYAELQRRL